MDIQKKAIDIMMVLFLKQENEVSTGGNKSMVIPEEVVMLTGKGNM